MNMLEKIQKLMLEKNIPNLHKLAEISGVPYTTLFSMFKRGYEKTSITTLNKLKSALGCTLDYLVRDDFDESDESSLQETLKLDELYASLNVRQKQVFHEVVKAQLGISNNLNIKPLKLFNQSACAGDGNYIDSDDYEVVEFINPPKTAQWTVRVQGSSMEPLIADGDILYINPISQLNNGEIGIFCYEGNTYVKQLRHIGSKTILHSFNPKFSDIEIKDPNQLYIHGRVL